MLLYLHPSGSVWSRYHLVTVFLSLVGLDSKAWPLYALYELDVSLWVPMSTAKTKGSPIDAT